MHNITAPTSQQQAVAAWAAALQLVLKPKVYGVDLVLVDNKLFPGGGLVCL